MKGKLFVIDGLDGSGKSTQAELVYKALQEKGIKSRLISFPCYDSQSSALIKMYLGGEFGSMPEDVNPYAASSFYAVDRYASYKTDWGNDYNNGTVIIAARYTTSNIIHQTEKLDESLWDEFMNWTQVYEYGQLGLPCPDKVIFLDMPVEISQKLLSFRYSGAEEKKDIHESDVEYLHKCRKVVTHAAKLLGWQLISCSDGENPLSVEEITKKILDAMEI